MYNNLIETLYVSSIPEFKKDIMKALQEDISDRIAENEVKLIFLKQLLKKNTPPYKKLFGDLQDAYSRRIIIQHRLIYQIYE